MLFFNAILKNIKHYRVISVLHKYPFSLLVQVQINLVIFDDWLIKLYKLSIQFTLHMFTIIGYNLIKRKKERYASIKLLLPTLPTLRFSLKWYLPVHGKNNFIYILTWPFWTCFQISLQVKYGAGTPLTFLGIQLQIHWIWR